MFTRIDLIMLIAVLALFLFVFLLKLYLDWKGHKVWEETRPAIENGWKELLGDKYDPVIHRLPTYKEELYGKKGKS